MADLKTTAEERARLLAAERILDDLDTLLAENARLNGDLDAIAVAMGLANEHEGHVERAGIERLCEDVLAARRAEATLAELQAENAALSEEAQWRRKDWDEHEHQTASHLALVRASKGQWRAECSRLLAENAKLLAVAEAARDACNIALNDAGPEAFATIADLRTALAALEAP